jgi:hypothetical protein
MSTTTQTAPVGSWLKISDERENVLISHLNLAPVQVFIGSADPDENSAYHLCTADRPFSMGGIPGQDVYIRSGGASAIAATVTAV